MDVRVLLSECCFREYATPTLCGIYGMEKVKKHKDEYQHKILSFSIFSPEISASVLTLKNPLWAKNTVAPHSWRLILIESQSLSSFSLGENSLCFGERVAVRGSERKWMKVMINQSQHVSSDVTVRCYNPFQWSTANEWHSRTCLQKWQLMAAESLASS